MKNAAEAVYCLACFSGQERKVEGFIKQSGYRVVSAIVERNIVKHGKRCKEFRSLLPGYVFLASEEQPEWSILTHFRYISHPLQYGDGTKHLRGDDLEFVHWLQRHNGVIKTSKVVQEGTKIKIVSGPLMEYEGKIVKINKRQKCAAVRIDSEKKACTVWLSFDIIEETK
jgi:transcription antitermination factor NusG